MCLLGGDEHLDVERVASRAVEDLTNQPRRGWPTQQGGDELGRRTAVQRCESNGAASHAGRVRPAGCARDVRDASRPTVRSTGAERPPEGCVRGRRPGPSWSGRPNGSLDDYHDRLVGSQPRQHTENELEQLRCGRGRRSGRRGRHLREQPARSERPSPTSSSTLAAGSSATSPRSASINGAYGSTPSPTSRHEPVITRAPEAARPW